LEIVKERKVEVFIKGKVEKKIILKK